MHTQEHTHTHARTHTHAHTHTHTNTRICLLCLFELIVLAMLYFRMSYALLIVDEVIFCYSLCPTLLYDMYRHGGNKENTYPKTNMYLILMTNKTLNYHIQRETQTTILGPKIIYIGIAI